MSLFNFSHIICFHWQWCEIVLTGKLHTKSLDWTSGITYTVNYILVILLLRWVASQWVNRSGCGGAQVMPAALWLCLPSDEFCSLLSARVSPSRRNRVSLTAARLAFGYWLMRTRLTVFSLCTWYQQRSSPQHGSGHCLVSIRLSRLR